MTGITYTDIIFLIVIVFLVLIVWNVVSGEFYRGISQEDTYKRLARENRQLKWENATLKAELDHMKRKSENPKVSVTCRGRWD